MPWRAVVGWSPAASDGSRGPQQQPVPPQHEASARTRSPVTGTGSPVSGPGRVIGRIDAADQPTGLVARMMAPCDVGQPTVSYHVRVLREAGIVTSERRRQWIFYRLAPQTADQLGAIARSLVPGGPDLGQRSRRAAPA